MRRATSSCRHIRRACHATVANVALVLAVNNQQLDECVGMITEREQQQILNGSDMVLGKA